MLAITIMVWVRDYPCLSAHFISFQTQRVRSHFPECFDNTFVQVTLKLIELALLQSYLHMNHMRSGRTTPLSPFARDYVSFLGSVRRARLYGRPEDNLNANDGGKQGSEDEHPDGQLGCDARNKTCNQTNDLFSVLTDFHSLYIFFGRLKDRNSRTGRV